MTRAASVAAELARVLRAPVLRYRRVLAPVVSYARPAGFGLALACVVGAAAPAAVVLATVAVLRGITSAGEHVSSAVVVLTGILALGIVADLVTQALAEVIESRVNWGVRHAIMTLAQTPVGVAHLEAGDIRDRLDAARGVLTDFTPGQAPAALARSLMTRASGLCGALLLVELHWWAGAAVVVAASVARVRLRAAIVGPVVAFRSGASIMRRAKYLENLLTSQGIADEARVFGHFGWLIERYRNYWFDGMREVWRLRSGLDRTVAVGALTLLVVQAGVLLDLIYSYYAGAADLYTVATIIPALLLAFSLVSVTGDDIAVEWMADSLARLEEVKGNLSQPTSAGAQANVGRAPSTERSARPSARVDFRGVSFSYPDSDRQVLRELSLSFSAGRSTAIVGVNGAGKSTLIKLMLGLYQPDVGTVEIDGVDLRCRDVRAWQRAIALVSQDFVRFPLTVAENVAMGAYEHSTDFSAVRHALHEAGALPFVDRLPDGVGTVLDTEGAAVGLSKGQWQRIALARALFARNHGAAVLVLDEPTAWLDARAEAEFFERFLELTQGTTTVVVSHRFSTVRRADTIHVIDGERLLESGSHGELMARRGHYAELFDLQAERFR